MKMFKEIRRSWRVLESGKPGDRFERYYRSQHEGRSPSRKVVSIVIGFAIVAAGIILLPAPGPGTLVVAVGLGLLAREFLIVARALDWLEPKLRKAIAAGERLWKRSSPLGRAALVLAAVVIVVGAALGGYELMFAD
ncbi:MAG TPA: PGPGW domain-containing protein [Thermoanaerobaculia bacterium]|nr:PGPGW domain-containing protein [Thermoanaerobaculia bacterium]